MLNASITSICAVIEGGVLAVLFSLFGDVRDACFPGQVAAPRFRSFDERQLVKVSEASAVTPCRAFSADAMASWMLRECRVRSPAGRRGPGSCG